MRLALSYREEGGGTRTMEPSEQQNVRTLYGI